MITDWLGLSTHPSPPPLPPPTPLSGWQILAEKEEEQLGCQTVPWCSQVKGEPNHRESGLSWAWECSTADRGRRATEGMRALQERGQPLRIQIWELVSDWTAEQGKCKMDVRAEELPFTLSSFCRRRLAMVSVLKGVAVRQVGCSELHITVRRMKSELPMKCRNKHF